MKANTVIFTLFISMIALISACNRPSADKFFQRTVLNTNILHDFAQASFTRTLTSTMVTHKGMPAGQQQNNQAQQIVEAKIAYATAYSEQAHRLRQRTTKYDHAVCK